MANVMTRAWEIATEGAAKFGGKKSEYIQQAMVIAWAESKKPVAPKKAQIDLPGDRRNSRTWIAQIVGKHPQFKFERKFMQHDDIDEYGDKIFYLTDGVYEFQNHQRRGYFIIENGVETFVEYKMMVGAVENMEVKSA